MRPVARIRPYIIPSLVGLTAGALFAILWLNVFGQQPVPLWALVAVGVAVFLVDPAVAAVRRARHCRGRTRRAHARPHSKARKVA